MRKRRKIETTDERSSRLEAEAVKKRAIAADDETALHEMIRRNIQLYGP